MRLRTLALVFGAGALLAAGLTFGLTEASASGPNVTYYACLDHGRLTQVGTTAPTTCEVPPPISWNSQGPQGVPGVPGPPGAGLLGWAHVNAAGTLASSSGNVTVTLFAAGEYCIGVTGGTAHVAVASLDSLQNTGGTVQAGVFDESGCPANASDILVITRPQSQDGGTPGVNHAFFIIIS